MIRSVLIRLLLGAVLTASIHVSATALQVVDDKGRSVRLDQPAQRIIALAPHITENLYAIGAGERIVGTVSYSDYPPAAEQLPRVGGYNSFDLEGIIAKKPDLVIAWFSGNPRAQLEHLERLGLTLYYSEPRRFADVADNLRRLGQLTGHSSQAEAAAQRFEADIQQLHTRYGERPPVSVFYQVWEQPLMTINRDHLIHEAITTCGGVNVFADLERLIPRISREAVLERNPEAIIGGGMGEDNPEWVQAWRRWPQLNAVAENHLFFIPPSLLQRHTVRIVEGMTMLCEHLDSVRQNRRNPSGG